jgi:hypothetical protein
VVKLLKLNVIGQHKIESTGFRPLIRGWGAGRNSHSQPANWTVDDLYIVLLGDKKRDQAVEKQPIAFCLKWKRGLFPEQGSTD